MDPEPDTATAPAPDDDMDAALARIAAYQRPRPQWGSSALQEKLRRDVEESIAFYALPLHRRIAVRIAALHQGVLEHLGRRNDPPTGR